MFSTDDPTFSNEILVCRTGSPLAEIDDPAVVRPWKGTSLVIKGVGAIATTFALLLSSASWSEPASISVHAAGPPPVRSPTSVDADPAERRARVTLFMEGVDSGLEAMREGNVIRLADLKSKLGDT
jgi:hypothetical protein